jgi:hypothetical protein
MNKFVERSMRRLLLNSRDPEVLASRYERLLRASRDVHDELRRTRARDTQVPRIQSVDGQDTLGVWVLHPQPPWQRLPVEPSGIPGMVSDEECQYYEFIGRFFAGVGETVELGPWLGRSTHHILKGLTSNPHFHGKRLHVFDDFVWRSSWMDRHPLGTSCPSNHEDFRYLFDQYTASLQEHITTQRRKFGDYDGNEAVAALTWDAGPIEFLYVDCGRTYATNEGWYSQLVRSFIPNRTLIMMQDWRVHREIPVQWYNQTKQFTDSKGDQIELIHELSGGTLAAFLFRG